MRGKSKSKKKSESGKTRVRFTLKDKKEIIARRKMGQSRETIQKKMGSMSKISKLFFFLQTQPAIYNHVIRRFLVFSKFDTDNLLQSYFARSLNLVKKTQKCPK